MATTRIAIVDENDNIIGAETKKVARKQGLRHRIARIFVINSAGQILLQRRSFALHDNPGKWDQSVGGHVDEGEDYEDAARREAQEELGIELRDLQNIGKVYVERPAEDGFVRRFQTVFVARYDGPLHPSEEEVAEIQWFSREEIRDWHRAKPDDFTKNFSKAFSLLENAGVH